MVKEIDYDKFINRDHIDMVKYEGKFEFVDKVMKLKNPNPKYLKRISVRS